jgi:hypothetical protein
VERGLAGYDPAHRVFYAALLTNDILVQLLVHSPLPLVCLGHIDQALSRRDAALAEARRLSHLLTPAATLRYAWLADWCIPSDPSSLLQSTDELLALSAEHGLGLSRAPCSRGSRLMLGGEGIPVLTAGLAGHQELRFFIERQQDLTLLSDAYRMAGQLPGAVRHRVRRGRRHASAPPEQAA